MLVGGPYPIASINGSCYYLSCSESRVMESFIGIGKGLSTLILLNTSPVMLDVTSRSSFLRF